MRRLLLPVTLSALVCTPAFAATSPSEVVNQFYTARLADGGSGVPSGRQLATYSTYLGPELVCSLGASIRYQDRFAQAHPDNPSGVFTNDLYSSSNAAPTAFTLGTANQSGGLTTIPVHFTLKGDDDATPKEWEDTVKLKLVRNHWQIVDIDYSGKLEGGNQGSLLTTLRDGLRKAPEVEGWSARELDSCIMDNVPAKGSAKGHGKSRHTKGSLHGKKGSAKASGTAKKSGTKGSKTTAGKKSNGTKTGKTTSKTKKKTK